MKNNPKILLLNLPGPPYQRLWRDTAGGFGTALDCSPKQKLLVEAPFHPFFPYASSVLSKNGYNFKIMDCQKLKLDNTSVPNEVKKENPDIIICVLSLPSMKNDATIIDTIKESLPDVLVIGVGTVCNVIPNEVLQESKIDIVVRDRYPYVSNMANLIDALVKSQNLKNVGNLSYKQNGNLVHTPNADESSINDLPFPCYDFLKLEGYESTTDTNGERFLFIPVIESIGCPYNCSYCPYPLGFGRKIMFRSPKDIADEMEHLNSVHGVRAFLLRGQTFAFDKKRSHQICEELVQRNLDVIWFCEARVDEVTKPLLEHMKKAGCRRIHYGVETGDPKTLESAKVGVQLETTKKAFKVTKEVGLLTQAHIILGWPDDDKETLNVTRKFILALEPDFINLNFLTPYPGTEMYEIAKKSSLILTTDWSNYTSHKVVMRTKTLSANEIYDVKKQIIRDFSKQQLKHLIQKDLMTSNKPRVMANRTKNLLYRIMFPHD